VSAKRFDARCWPGVSSAPGSLVSDSKLDQKGGGGVEFRDERLGLGAPTGDVGVALRVEADDFWFSGGAELALGRARSRARDENVPFWRTKLAASDRLTGNRKPKWKSQLMVPVECATGTGSFTEGVVAAVDCANGSGFEAPVEVPARAGYSSPRSSARLPVQDGEDEVFLIRGRFSF
jgi:hypothetical protein